MLHKGQKLLCLYPGIIVPFFRILYKVLKIVNELGSIFIYCVAQTICKITFTTYLNKPSTLVNPKTFHTLCIFEQNAKLKRSVILSLHLMSHQISVATQEVELVSFLIQLITTYDIAWIVSFCTISLKFLETRLRYSNKHQRMNH